MKTLKLRSIMKTIPLGSSPAFLQERMMYPGGDPENGPACKHVWDGKQWIEASCPWPIESLEEHGDCTGLCVSEGERREEDGSCFWCGEPDHAY